MSYKEIIIEVEKDELQDILIALLADIGYDGFEQDKSSLKAFIEVDVFDQEQLTTLLAAYQLTYTINDIAQQNWNAVWEQNFEPVVVDDLCVVRAAFHRPVAGTLYEVVITPKMSFGTGHHATTKLMIRQMGDLDFKSKSVFDFGTGTGVLAILAAKMGATSVLAIDNDEWSYQNAKENVAGNGVTQVHISMEHVETIGEKFDIILANINRHILLAHIQQLWELCATNGRIIMSGLLHDDKEIILNAATSSGFKEGNCQELNGWVSLLFYKN